MTLHTHRPKQIWRPSYFMTTKWCRARKNWWGKRSRSAQSREARRASKGTPDIRLRGLKQTAILCLPCRSDMLSRLWNPFRGKHKSWRCCTAVWECRWPARCEIGADICAWSLVWSATHRRHTHTDAVSLHVALNYICKLSKCRKKITSAMLLVL